MANTTQVSFRIDENVKREAENTLNEMGLTISTAMSIFLTKVSREHRIPFEITAEPLPSDKDNRYLTKIIDGVESGNRPLVEHELIEE